MDTYVYVETYMAVPCLALVAMAAEYYRRRAAVSNQRGTPQTWLVCSVSWPRFAERSS